MITCKNLTKCYESFEAVSDVSFSIPKGHIRGFLGMNGAGKTTTIRMLTGVIEPSSGSISIAGFNFPEQIQDAKRVVGYIPDRPYLYPKMNPLEFLSFIAELYEVPSELVSERIESLLKKYGLWEKRKDLIRGFSHGMKQRLATAAALIHDPKVLIIDEPMVGLDPHGAKTLKSSLREYASQGMTIFLSTHSLYTAEELCDSVMIIHHGKILSEGSVEEIKQIANDSSSNLEHVFIELTREAGGVDDV